MEGDLPVNGGDPGGKRRHFIVAVVFSRYDEGRQFDVGFGAVGLSWRIKSVKSRCAALLLGFFDVRIPLCTPEIRFFH